MVLEREAVGERLGDRLDRELLVDVTDLVRVPTDRDHADRERVGIGHPELRDVGGDVAVAQVATLGMELLEVGQHRGRHVTESCAQIVLGVHLH